jgi:hypothetical protein
LIQAREWELYRSAMEALRQAGVRFMIGGAFGLAAYTGRWRNTKDIDFFLLPTEREAGIRALSEIGFTDYYEHLAYDRGWIYRATKSDVIVDLIWATPNRRTEVDELWLENSPCFQLRGEELAVLPAEELAWIKLYVLQRDRCDWPDVINLLYSTSAHLDWDRLIRRVGEDLPLLCGLLSVFGWLCPDRIATIPPRLRRRLAFGRGRSGVDMRRVALLDSRPWFAAEPEGGQAKSN